MRITIIFEIPHCVVYTKILYSCRLTDNNFQMLTTLIIEIFTRDINSRHIVRPTMSTECGISTKKWPEIQQKGQHNSPEDLTHQFPEKRGTGFPKCDQVNFPETGSEFREIGVFLGNQVIFLGDWWWPFSWNSGHFRIWISHFCWQYALQIISKI